MQKIPSLNLQAPNYRTFSFLWRVSETKQGNDISWFIYMYTCRGNTYSLVDDRNCMYITCMLNVYVKISLHALEYCLILVYILRLFYKS